MSRNGTLPLRKCPFCGATATISKVGKKGLYQVWAQHSDACLLNDYKNPMSFDKNLLAKRWNMRKGKTTTEEEEEL